MSQHRPDAAVVGDKTGEAANFPSNTVHFGRDSVGRWPCEALATLADLIVFDDVGELAERVFLFNLLPEARR